MIEYVCKKCGACFVAEKPECTCCKSTNVHTIEAHSKEAAKQKEESNAKPKPA